MLDTAAPGLIDLGRYPIADLGEAAARRFVENGRGQIAARGACVLPGFLRPAAVAAIQAETAALIDHAYYCAHDHNVFLIADDPAYAPDHPRNRPQASDLGCLADDQIPAGAALRTIYDWPALRGFIAAVLDKPALHPYADPLGSLNINVSRAGQQLGWHFDNADFVTTIMLQQAERGGVFEYLPRLRQPGDDNHAGIGRVLDGARRGVRRIDGSPGTLVLFRGRYSLHRVTPVEGTRARLTAVLAYDTEPGRMLTEHTRRLFYGRVA